MRRKEREIKDPDIIHEILSQSSICRLAIHDEPYPYLVPMNFGYRNNALYFHCATGGRKLDLIKQNNKVGFEIEFDSKLIRGDVACQWTTKYRSIIGTGEMHIITNDDEKRDSFDIIMKQHGKHDNTYIQAALDKALVLKLKINSLSAKEAGDW